MSMIAVTQEELEKWLRSRGYLAAPAAGIAKDILAKYVLIPAAQVRQ
jgi:hypothetical protein